MKKLLFIALLYCNNFTASAQHTELGAELGLGFYSGDVSHNLLGTIAEARGVYGAFARKNTSDYVAFKLNFAYGHVSGRDSRATEPDLKARDLSFRTRIMELGLTAEYNILGYQPEGMYQPFSPYVFLGVSGFSYNPQARYNSEWIDLRPLQTEGNAYNSLNFAIPFGAGVKYALNDHWNLNAALTIRPTFTDYLDDVSKNYLSRTDLLATGGEAAANLGNKIDAATGQNRGNASSFDWFHTLSIGISYNFIDNGLIGSRKALRGRKGCKQSLF